MPKNHNSIVTQQLQTLINKRFSSADAMELVKNNADPDVKNEDGDALIHLLIKYNIYYQDNHNNDAIHKLVHHYGANINIQNNRGETPLEILLDCCGFKTTDALFLVENGANPNTVNSQGDPLLHLLVIYNSYSRDSHNADAIDKLVNKYHADVDSVNVDNMTALQVVISNSGFLTQNAMQLVRLSANPRVRSRNGNTLLELLYRLDHYRGDQHNKDAIYELLTKYNALSEVSIPVQAGQYQYSAVSQWHKEPGKRRQDVAADNCKSSMP